MKVRSIALFANTTKPAVAPLVAEMESYFRSEGCDTCVVNLSSTSDDNGIVPPDVDLAVSLGGDGTAITCADILKGTGTPVMAVKVGTFGYITEISGTEYRSVFKDYVSGKTGVSEKMMLDVSVVNNGKKLFDSTALNEITVSSYDPVKLSHISLYIDDVLAANLKADGLIIATPTGSTAYNLSAGGPILDSAFDSIIVNAICPFALNFRPLVVNGDTRIVLRIPAQKSSLTVMADGHFSYELKEGDEIVIGKSIFRAPFVKNPDRNFIDVLRDKLGWAGGFND